MKYPKVSVVTPSLNQGKYIERTILSVLNQDYPNIEYIVMDGGSTDGTLDILKRYEGRLTWISEPDKGQSHAINEGWKMSSGDILAYLNSDDTYKPGAVFCAVEYLMKNQNVMMVYSGIDVIDHEDKLIRFFQAPEFDVDRLIKDCNYFLPQQGVFFRKNILEKVGYLDESLHFKMDREFYIRVGMHGEVRRLPRCLANGRIHAEAKQNIRNEDKIWKEFILIRKQYGAPFSIRNLIIRYYRLSKHKLLIDHLMKFSKRQNFINQKREGTVDRDCKKYGKKRK